ncbi:PREDICTED: protein INCA1 [Elephantulus edwardii]|uniref:protein INCA1 n=1 Tax=Elephantulus edwardii TaxID=28737 RepID=UPI0003F0671E|nr:PREDICTED: protein INCA1 [Elephantulus edwardii]
MQEQEDGNNFIPFAKCSSVVTRSPPPSLPSQNLRITPQSYGDIFWKNLSQRPSSIWMEEQNIPPILKATSCFQAGLYMPEGLTPPEMLCRRRKPRLMGVQQGPGGIPARVRAVTFHLEDLRRRQGLIDELKKAQWGGSGATSEPLGPGEGSPGFLGTTDYSSLDKERAPFLQEEDGFLTPGRAQLLWSPWSPLGQEESCFARGQSFLASYSTVPACRTPLHGLGREEFELSGSRPSPSAPSTCSPPPGARQPSFASVTPDSCLSAVGLP